MRRQIGLLRIPESAEEIVKGTDTGSVPKFETAEDGIKRIDLQLGCPVSQGVNFKINRQQIRTLAYRKESLALDQRQSILNAEVHRYKKDQDSRTVQ